MALRPEDLQSTFCATLVDEWVRCGVQHAVVCPGSRSTPLALALVADDRLTLHVQHDERSGGFMALGLALASAEPTIVVTTSGTAAVELHAAVVEADLAGVPLIVCTADRPPELHDVGAAQAIDQTHLFGRSVRWFHAPGVADAAAGPRWRPLAARAYAAATEPDAGPVHLNLAFREPLLGTAAALPTARPVEGAGWAWRPPAAAPADPVVSLTEDLAGRRGVIVAGAGSGDGDVLHAVASALGWPVLAAPQASVWGVPDAVIGAADGFLRDAGTAERLRPEVVVRLGGPLASRVVGEWIAGTGAAEITAAGPSRWVDPQGTASVVLALDAATLLAAWAQDLDVVSPVDRGAWLAAWQATASAARGAIDAMLAAEPAVTEPGTAQVLVDALPSGATLVASSSMPIRDLEWYVAPTRPLVVLANRGANGIDGVVSTAVGAALASGPTALLIGDVAFLHDSNGLLGAAGRGIDLVIVVVDNDGGGIFSFLPQADGVDPAVFERLYATPHGIDLAQLAAAHGVAARTVGHDDLGPSLASALASGGVQVLVVRTDRAANVDLHRRLNAAIVEAIGPLSG